MKRRVGLVAVTRREAVWTQSERERLERLIGLIAGLQAERQWLEGLIGSADTSRLPPAVVGERLYTMREAAEFAHVHVKTIGKAIRTGRLPALYVGRQPRLSEASILRWLERK